MIDLKCVSKRYGSFPIVNDISLSIKSQQIFGILGSNGAGKTTLLRMLCGVIPSTKGQITINGVSVEKSKHLFGYVSQHVGLYEDLSVWENLKFYATLYSVDDTPRLTMLLHRYGLDAYRNRLCGTLSGGYKRRLGIACALSHDPDILFLDEPTAGIDPLTRKLLWDDLYALRQEGKTIVVTTHYMGEAQRCSTLLFLSHGRSLALGTPESIKASLTNVRTWVCRIEYRPDIHHKLTTMSGILVVNQFGEELRIVAEDYLSKRELEERLSVVSGGNPCLEEGILNLEDVFISLIGKENLR